MGAIKHSTTATTADDPGAEINKDEWNANHDVTITPSDIGAEDAGTAATLVAAHEADTTSVHGITDTSSLYRSGGTDVAVADGGTGSSTAAGARTSLGLAIGTDVEAWDADLDAFKGLAIAADKLPYGSGSHAMSLTDFTAYARTLLDDANAAAARATLSAVGKGELVFNVRDYGAVGDGVTDDSTAIQAAIDAAEAAGGGVVLASVGLYAIGTTLTLRGSNIELRFPFHALGDSVYERGATFQLLTGAANSGQKVIPIADTSSFAVGERVYLGQTNALFESGVIASKVTNTSITLVSNLTITHAIGTVVSKPWSPDRFGEPYAEGLLWIGSNGGTMLDIKPDQGSSLSTALTGLNVRASLFAGVAPFTSVAAIGLELQGVHASDFRIWGWETSSAIVHMNGVNIPPGPPTNYNDISINGNNFHYIGGFQLHRAGAILDLQGGGPYRNVFHQVVAHYKDGDAVIIRDGGDNNIFLSTVEDSFYGTVSSLPAAFGRGVYLAPGSTDYAVPHLNTWFHIAPGAGNFVSPDGASAARSAYGNEIAHFDPDISGVTAPSVGSLGSLIWRTVGKTSDGTAFPASPATGDRFFRTDRGILYFYNGTRWLSVQLFAATAASAAAGSQDSYIGLPYAEVTDKWIESINVSVTVDSGGTALSGSHKWVLDVYKQGTGGAFTAVSSPAVTLNSGASNGSWRTPLVVAINALIGTTYSHFRLIWTKTGTPGVLEWAAAITYRLVG